MSIEARKRDHIKISLNQDVSYKEKTSWFEFVELVHNAAPELSEDELRLEARFLDKTFGMPLLIEGMTGGTAEAEKINGNLAEAAATLKIPTGVGSQRAAIVRPELARTFRIARDRAPDGFLIANIGGVQLVEHGPELAIKAIEMIDADAIAIHLNPLQELVQPDGLANFRGLLRALRELRRELNVPIIVKEVGCGISGDAARRLEEAGASAIDVAGSGGTNWTLIELIRAEELNSVEKARVAETFLEWGIPTAAATLEVRAATSLYVVASGGMRTGLDAAKAIALGADMVGFAHPLLEPAARSAEAVIAKLKQIAAELKAALLLTGSGDIEKLKAADFILLGPLLQWAEQRCREHPKLRNKLTHARR
ncbi:MAG: type 2 isopentenyl-diphosphate Delta-isomerase [Aigarchaeota archaeon]|nr:type 2 isopentenyl-diphosphate Delta-isomerase [Candidatus Pelearchaeum maunauluense]